jgi:hypothetical protein
MGASGDDMGSLESNSGMQNESRSRLAIDGVSPMRIKLNYLTPLLAAGGAAVAIAAAPLAAAATAVPAPTAAASQQSCNSVRTGILHCSTPQRLALLRSTTHPPR